MSPEEEIVRAGKARDILNSEIFKEAVSAIEEALRSARLSSGITSVELREKLWAQEVALHSILGQLRNHIESGQLAEKTLLERAQDFFNVN